VRIDERWLWLGDTLASADAGITILRAYPGAYWIVVGQEMLGAYDDNVILRTVRVACTPTIDGCELGPWKLGIADLGPRRRLNRNPTWVPVREDELPPSTTAYDRERLEPISGCCTRDGSMPKIGWGPIDDWQAYVESAPAHAGRLLARWNAHPAGSLVFADSTALAEGFTIIDL
jgi:hypothetical protein